MAAVDEAKYLQLAESLAGFRSKLRVRAEALDIAVRQQILRLLVKEVLVEATRLPCAIRFRFRNRAQGRTDRRHRHPASPDLGRTQVIFCVRGVLSPLLSNVYLHWFDKLFHRADGPAQWAGAKLVRYADDFVVLARYQGTRLTGWTEDKLEDWLKLEINRDKTRVVTCRKKERVWTFWDSRSATTRT